MSTNCKSVLLLFVTLTEKVTGSPPGMDTGPAYRYVYVIAGYEIGAVQKKIEAEAYGNDAEYGGSYEQFGEK